LVRSNNKECCWRCPFSSGRQRWTEPRRRDDPSIAAAGVQRCQKSDKGDSQYHTVVVRIAGGVDGAGRWLNFYVMTEGREGEQPDLQYLAEHWSFRIQNSDSCSGG